MAKTVNGGSWEEYRNLLLTQLDQVFTGLEEVKRNTEVASKERLHLDLKLSAMLKEQKEYREEQDKFKTDLETLREQFNAWMREQAMAHQEPVKKPTEALVEEVKQRWQLYAIIIISLTDLVARWLKL